MIFFVVVVLYDFLYYLILSMSRIFFFFLAIITVPPGNFLLLLCLLFLPSIYGNKWATCLLIIRHHYNYFKNHNIDFENFTENTSFNESQCVSIPSGLCFSEDNY